LQHCTRGNYCTIKSRQKYRRPEIGNEVWIGPNAVIVGNIKIGNNVLIAPNAYVNIDIPDNAIVIGNPASYTVKDNATQDYINNKIEY
jgi:serine O-acetyltransferase